MQVISMLTKGSKERSLKQKFTERKEHINLRSITSGPKESVGR